MKDYLTTWLPQWFAADGDGFDYTLTSGLGDWDPPTGADAPVGSPTRVQIPTVIPPSVTAYVAYMAKITADSARALGKPDEAAQFDTLFNNIKADFNAKWWDAGVGYYRETPAQIFAQTTQVLALAFGLVPAERRRGLQEKLVDDVLVTRAGHQMVGIAGNRWIHPVLSQAAREGVPDAAKAVYTVALQTTYPSFGYWASLGWTSLGEFWESSSRTRNHHFFGTIVQWFYEELAGIQPLEPGYCADRDQAADRRRARASTARRRPTTASAARSSRAGSSQRPGIRMDVTIPAEHDRAGVGARHRSEQGRRARQRPRAAGQERAGRVARRRRGGRGRVPGRLGRLPVRGRRRAVRGHRGAGDRRRHRARHAVAHARGAGDVRRVHAGRHARVHGVDDGQRDQHGRRRGAERSPHRPISRTGRSAAAAAAGGDHPGVVDGAGVQRRGGDPVQAVDRGQRAVADRRLQPDADVHAVDHAP